MFFFTKIKSPNFSPYILYYKFYSRKVNLNMSAKELIGFSLREDGSLVVTQDGNVSTSFGKVNEVTMALAQTRNESGMPQIIRVVKMVSEVEPEVKIGQPSANLRIQEFIVPVVETVAVTEDN
jgi:hypothetical protein